MPKSVKKRGGRPITVVHPLPVVFAVLVATFLKAAQSCSMGPTVRHNVGQALKVLGITATAWTSTEICRWVIEPCLRKLADDDLSPYINKLMGQVSGRDGRRGKTLQLLRDIILFFIYHIAQVDETEPVVDYESFVQLCEQACPSNPMQLCPSNPGQLSPLAAACDCLYSCPCSCT